MGREPRDCRCYRCENMRAQIRSKKIELVWHIAEAIFALALAAAIGALLVWSSAKHAEHYEERTQPRGLNHAGRSD